MPLVPVLQRGSIHVEIVIWPLLRGLWRVHMQIKGCVGQGPGQAGFSGGHSDSGGVIVTDYQTCYEGLSLFICSSLCTINSNMENASVVIEHCVPGPTILKVKAALGFLDVHTNIFILVPSISGLQFVFSFLYIVLYFFKPDCCPHELGTFAPILVTYLLIKIAISAVWG